MKLLGKEREKSSGQAIAAIVATGATAQRRLEKLRGVHPSETLGVKPPKNPEPVNGTPEIWR